MSEGTVADALMTYVLKDLGREEGEINFDRFIELSKHSSIPDSLADVPVTIRESIKRDSSQPTADEAFLQIAMRLYEKDFKNPTLATYAVLYGQAIAATKAWLKESNKLDQLTDWERKGKDVLHGLVDAVKEKTGREYSNPIEALSSLQNLPEDLIPEVREYLDAIEMVQEFKLEATPLLKELKRMATVKCGKVVILEQQEEGKSLGQNIADRIQGKLVTERDLKDVSNFLEEYFLKPGKQARITLLAQPKSK